jgi:hypothetical protein
MTLNSQMRDIQMPLSPVGNKNVSIRPMCISDFVDFDVRWQNVHYHRFVERDYTGAEFFASYELALRRIHRKKVAFYADKIAFMPFHRADKMTPCVTLEELPMNDVKVFACVKDHKLLELGFAWIAREGLRFSGRNYFGEVIRRVQLPDFRNSRIFLCSSGVRLARTRICIMATSHWAGLKEPGDLIL